MDKRATMDLDAELDAIDGELQLIDEEITTLLARQSELLERKQQIKQQISKKKVEKKQAIENQVAKDTATDWKAKTFPWTNRIDEILHNTVSTSDITSDFGILKMLIENAFGTCSSS
jgi:hypothetical protein